MTLVTLRPDGLRIDKVAVEIYLHHAAVFRDPAQEIVGNIPWHIAKRAGGRMRSDNPRLRNIQRVAHRLVRYVRDIDQHTQPIHLAHDFFSKVTEADMLFLPATTSPPIIFFIPPPL